MKKNIFPAFFLLLVPVLFSCAGRTNIDYIPVPENEYFKPEKRIIEVGNITETRDGDEDLFFPDWLLAFFNGGIDEVEKIDSYRGKYVYIASNEGVHFTALDIWANNFSQEKDFSILAAKRIERRMISTSSLYPDDEYGIFFETMVKNSYNAVFPGAVKEDTYWIKKINDSADSSDEIYNFFVLLTIDRTRMQADITGMLTETITSVNPTGTQRSKVYRLREIFFWGF